MDFLVSFYCFSFERMIFVACFQWYTKDLFGLRTLDQRGALHTCTVHGVKHIFWHSNYTVFTKCIEPWLT